MLDTCLTDEAKEITMTRNVLTLGGACAALLLSACNSSDSSPAAPATQVVTPPPAAAATEGSWSGSIDTPLPGSRGLRAVFLPDGNFWMTYTREGSGSIAGIIQGQGHSGDGGFSASDATLLSLEDNLPSRVNLTASAVAGSSLSGTLQRAGEAPVVTLPDPATFSALYELSSQHTVTLADLAGLYSGLVTNAAGTTSATVTVDATGHFSGSNSEGCSLSGDAVAPASGNVFTLTMRFGSEAACGANGGVEAGGVINLEAGQLTVLALDASHLNSFIFNGSR